MQTGRFLHAPLLTSVSCIIFLNSLQAQPERPPDNPASVKFFGVIRSGDTAALNKAIDEGADVNATVGSRSALMAACLNGSAEEMKILIDHGAKVNYADKDSITALWLAVPDWNKTVLLLDHGADPKLYSKERYTVLVKLANFPGTAKLFQLLIDHGVDPKKSAYDNTLLYIAASTDDTAIVGLLLRSGLKANDTVSSGDYPIGSALNFRCFSTLKMLVDNGADVNVAPMRFQLDLLNGISPLMFAAVSNDRPSFFYLLGHGANVNAKSKKGYTPLMYLEQSEKDDPEMTQALIDHGAVVSAKAPDGSDALYFARRRGNSPSVQILRKYINQ